MLNLLQSRKSRNSGTTVAAIDIGSETIRYMIFRCEAGAEKAAGLDELSLLGYATATADGIKNGHITHIHSAADAIKRAASHARAQAGIRPFSHLVAISSGLPKTDNITVSHKDEGFVTKLEAVQSLRSGNSYYQPLDPEQERRVIALLPGTYRIDGVDGVHCPSGIQADSIEQKVTVCSAASSQLNNLEYCLQLAGVRNNRYIPSSVASLYGCLHPDEIMDGAACIDIGNGTVKWAIAHNDVIIDSECYSWGSELVTSDIANILQLPKYQARRLKFDHGRAYHRDEDSGSLAKVDSQYISINGTREHADQRISISLLNKVIEARLSELLVKPLEAMRDYATTPITKVVFTGETCRLANFDLFAKKSINIPVRVATSRKVKNWPENLSAFGTASVCGLARLHSKLSTQLDYHAEVSSRSKKTALNEVSSWFKANF